MDEFEFHLDKETNELFRKLQESLIRWERATGRSSVLIFREQGCPQVRWVDGVPADPQNQDLSDEHLFKAIQECGF